MTDYLWILARMYIALRLGYQARVFGDLYGEIETALNENGSTVRPVANMTDNEIREAFRPQPIVQPVNEKKRNK